MDSNRHPTIGVILGSIGDLFQSHVWPGIADAARERGAGLIVYSGKIPNTPILADRELGVIYGMPDKSRIDGIVLFTSVLCNFMEKGELESFYGRYAPIPLVAVSQETGDSPCVLIDNKAGMYSLVEHFVRDHGYRRIAFIKGPEHSIEAANRFAAYREALAVYGIAYDESIVVQGNFLVESGMEGARTLIDDRKAVFDALIAANDGMLFGAISILRERGLSVPGDVAVGGFDDVDDARSHSPPITTVAQPLYTIGKVSCNLMLDMLEGRNVPRRTFVPCHLVIRRSCGCAAGTAHSREIKKSFDVRIKESVSNQKLLDAFEKMLEDEIAGKNSPGDFVDAFSDILESGIFGEGDFRDIGSMLDVIAVHAGKRSSGERIACAEILTQARYLLTEFMGRKTNWTQFANQLSILQRLSKSLSTALSLEGICSALQATLTETGIAECYISLSAGDASTEGSLVEPPEESLLVFAFADGVRLPVDEGGVLFKTRNLTPAGFPPYRGKGTYIVFPLLFRDENFGFIVIELSRAARVIFSMEYLHDQLSGAFKALRILQELKVARERLIYSEKMASLGALTAGIAHELKNPLNFVNNFADGIGALLDETEGALNRAPEIGEETKRKIADPLGEIRQAASSIAFHGKKADRIIRAMLNQARGDNGKAEIASVNEILHESSILAYHSARMQFPSLPVDIEEKYDKEIPAIVVSSDKLGRVFTNMLSNAYYAMLKKSEATAGFTGKMALETRIHDGMIVITIEDNGTGIPEKERGRLFEPFFTTKPPNEGTGLGLKICREIIVDGLQGSIDVASVEGEYARFTITLPVGGTPSAANSGGAVN